MWILGPGSIHCRLAHACLKTFVPQDDNPVEEATLVSILQSVCPSSPRFLLFEHVHVISKNVAF